MSYGKENAESSAQVIVALTALGINPKTDGRFVKKRMLGLFGAVGISPFRRKLFAI